MKQLALVTLLATTAISSGTTKFTFDGADYVYASKETSGSPTLVEYTLQAESLDRWSKLISFQCHPKAAAIKDVLNPYLKARQPLYAVAPEVYKNGASLSDISVVLFLGMPGMEHLEFVISRFVEVKDSGVFVIAYSQRFPMSKNVNVSAAIEGKDRIKSELAQIDTSLVSSSCASEPRA